MARADGPDTRRRDARVAALAAAQHGLVAVRQLRACGLNANAVAVRVRNGWLHRVHRGVYAVGHIGITRSGRFMAAVPACGADAALAHRAAAAHLRLAPWEVAVPEVVVPAQRRRRVDGVRIHRSRTLHPAADVVVHDAIRVTSPARTALDLAAALAPPALRRVVRQGYVDGLLTTARLRDVLDRAPTHRGARALRALTDEGPVRTRSELEDVLVDLVATAGLPPPEVNAALRLDGRRVEVDCLWRAARLAVEADGSAFHDNPAARRADADRQALLEAHGYRVLRVTWRQAVHERGRTIARLHAALRT